MGDKVTPERQEELKDLIRASRSGDQDASLKIIKIREPLGSEESRILHRLELESLADDGHVPSMVEFGGYLTKINSRNDYKLGIYWYQAAAERNDPEALYSLGLHALQESKLAGGKKDGPQKTLFYRKAVALFKSAEGLGHPGAMFELGVLYAEGKGVAKSPDEALQRFILAEQLAIANGQAELMNDFARKRRLFSATPDGKQASSRLVSAFSAGNSNLLSGPSGVGAVTVDAATSPQPPRG